MKKKICMIIGIIIVVILILFGMEVFQFNKNTNKLQTNELHFK